MGQMTHGSAARRMQFGATSDRRRATRCLALVTAALGLSFAPLMAGATAASAATPLTVLVGYMDKHTVGFSTKQPNPWPYTDSSSFAGSPCPKYPNDTTCWDASAIRLDNPGSTDVTGVQVVVNIGTRSTACGDPA